MGRVVQFPLDGLRRKRMASALECAARCIKAAAEEDSDRETADALMRAAGRYLGLFQDLAAARVA